MTPDGHGGGLVPDEVAAYADPTYSIGYLLRLAFRASSLALERRTLVQGVSSGQWHYLRELWRQDGLTQSELSLRVGTREPTTVVALNKLAKIGLVTREQDAVDRRKSCVRLTEKARGLMPFLLAEATAVNARATAGLTPEETATLRSGLKKIAQNLGREVSRPGP